jgi:hypothetical protein
VTANYGNDLTVRAVIAEDVDIFQQRDAYEKVLRPGIGLSTRTLEG